MPKSATQQATIPASDDPIKILTLFCDKMLFPFLRFIPVPLFIIAFHIIQTKEVCFVNIFMDIYNELLPKFTGSKLYFTYKVIIY